MNERVLFVDDEVNVLAGLERQFKRKFDTHTAEGGEKALSLMADDGPVAVVISDMRMPEMNGVEFLARVKSKYPDTIRIMLTGNNDQETAVEAINEGDIFRFFTKPCSPEKLLGGIEDALQQYRLITSEKVLLEQTLGGSVKVLLEVLSLVDPDGAGKAGKVRKWASDIAKWTGWSNPWKIELATMLSPIGRIALPTDLMAKADKNEELSADELATMERSPEISRNLIANIPRLKGISKIIYYQNKNFDGSGFPHDDVSGEDIPLEARILHILNDLAGITNSKTSELPFGTEFDQLEHQSGRYDPKLLTGIRAYFVNKKEGLGDKEATSLLEVSIAQLRPGDVLVSDLKTKKDVLALGSGQEISQVIREKLNIMSQTGGLGGKIRILRSNEK